MAQYQGGGGWNYGVHVRCHLRLCIIKLLTLVLAWSSFLLKLTLKSDQYSINNIVMELSLISIHAVYNYSTCIDGVIHISFTTKDSCYCMFGSEVGPAGYQQGHIDGLLLISTQLSNSHVPYLMNRYPSFHLIDHFLCLFSPS